MMLRNHNIDGAHISIEWERLDLEDDAGDGHVYCYGATGESKDGHSWSASWIEVDGHFIEIEDIELEEERQTSI